MVAKELQKKLFAPLATFCSNPIGLLIGTMS